MKKILALILTFAFVVCLSACGAEKNDTTVNQPNNDQNQTQTSSKEDTIPKFEVTVTDTDGVAVKDVVIQLCKESCVPARTDENGVAVFNVEITDGYKLSVMSCPEGYEYTGEAEIYLEDGDTSFTIEISKK